MKNICVIGGSGFVGTRLIQQIGKENCYNIDKNPSPFYNEITEIQNICQTDLAKALSTSTSIIVLLAAEHTDDILPVSLYYEVNVQGTKNVLEAMDKNNIRNIIFTSSVAIYGLNNFTKDTLSCGSSKPGFGQT